MKKLVLHIEDDRALQTWLKESLPSDLFIVESADSGREAFELAAQRKPDMILLDWNLPGWNGLDICKAFRANPAYAHIPIIMLTAYSKVQYKTAAFNVGADDYITKPFEMEELMARIRAVLRRHGTAPEEILRVPGITLNLSSYTVDVDKKPLVLTATEFNLLHLLMANPGQLLTRAYLLERVWGYAQDISTRTIDVYILRLRKKLGPRRATYIKSVHKQGYKFDGNRTEKLELAYA